MEASRPPAPRIVPRRFRGRISTVRAGTLAALIIIVAVYLGFTKNLPWQQPFEFNAVFQTSNNLRLDSPVRIAGVNVGKVTKVEREKDSNLVRVTMAIQDTGLPIHKDATAYIRSRIFLEGNFFVDLKPGTPQAPTVHDGGTIPITQTSTPVQLDELLTALQTNDREYLQELLKGFGNGLTRKPSAADDASQDKLVRGKSAAQALNDSLNYAPDAFKNAALVNTALLGTEPHDLSKLIAGLNKVTGGLAKNEVQLKDLITNFNRFFATFAAEEQNLSRSVRLLAPTIEHAHSSLTHLNEALPQLSGFARDIIPGVKETPPTITAVTPWIAQADKLFSQAEAGGLLHSLRPAMASFAAALNSSFDLFQQTNLTSRCFNEVILPASDTVLQDGPGTTGAESWKEFWYTMVGFAGETQGFDGAGSYVRTATGGGGHLVQTGKLKDRPKNRDQLFGNALLPPIGTRPARPSKTPPFKTDVACYKNLKPNLNGPAAGPGPPDKLLRAHGSGGNP
jgi:phospholipid/cholesterol/gamma-HCH transport system substrate-binding protein